MRGGDLYSKTPSPINHSMPYFHTMAESSYMSHPRLAVLQHQLHLSTNNFTSMDISRSHNWSNLVIPYHQQANYNTPNSPLENLERSNEVQTITESENRSRETKKKNPYSIEELLKKPDKKVKPINFGCPGFQQPYGGLVIAAGLDREVSCHSGNSDSEHEKDFKIDVE